mgnify:CR=1 FL=1
MVVGSFILGRYVQSTILDNFEVKILSYEKEENRFTEQKLVDMLKQYNVQHPEIVLAQAYVESGLGKSFLFKANHNLFGMREAKARLTNNLGTENNHAVYKNWKECVIDYVLFQQAYMHNMSEQQYYQALDASYAEVGGTYSGAIKQTIQKYNLKSKF